MTKELLDRASQLDRKLQKAEFESHQLAECSYDILIYIDGRHWSLKDVTSPKFENEIKAQIHEKVEEMRGNIQAAFDALGNESKKSCATCIHHIPERRER